MSDSDTPRTDIELFNTIPRSTNEGTVSVDFARKLERELAAANARAENWEESARQYSKNADYWRERAEKAKATLADAAGPVK